MPLRDHFRPPLSEARFWMSFHGYWATKISDSIYPQLPQGYVSEPLAQFGVEIDVATFDHRRNGATQPGKPIGEWATAPTLTLTGVRTLTDSVGVQILAPGPGRRLVGAIELVSPANKDRTATQNAFVSKCLTVLRAGVGLIVVDIVTERPFQLHQAILDRWSGTENPAVDADLSAVAFRPLLNEDLPPELTVWAEVLVLGSPLPTVPLWVLGVGPIHINLEATYNQAIAGLHIEEE